MKIAHVASGLDRSHASFRYRMMIPGRELAARGHRLVLVPHSAAGKDLQADAALFMKHFDPGDVALARSLRARGVRVVFDVCDDHFGHRAHAPHYLAMIDAADAVTAPTAEMARVVARHAPGKRVELIPDPYEHEESPPHAGACARLVWFGHASNAPELLPFLPGLTDWALDVVTSPDAPIATTPWSPESVRAALARAHVALIASRKPAASANRLVEAVRSGCFVVASDTPDSYREFAGFRMVWRDVPEGLRWAREHRSALDELVSAAQAYVRERFAPARIAGRWEEVFSA